MEKKEKRKKRDEDINVDLTKRYNANIANIVAKESIKL